MKKKRLSMKNLKKGLIGLIVLEIISFAVLGQISHFMYRKMASNTRKMADMLIDKVAYDLKWLDINLNQTVINDAVWEGIAREGSVEYVQNMTALKRNYKTIKEQYGENFNCFLMDAGEGTFRELTAVHINFESYKKIRRFLSGRILQEAVNGEWKLQELDGENFVYTFYRYHGRIVGAWIDQESLLDKLNRIDYGKNGGLTLLSKGKLQQQGAGRPFLTEEIRYGLKPGNTDFGILVTIRGNDRIRAAFSLQYMVLLVGILIVFLSMLLSRFIRRKFLIPMEQFSLYLKERPQEEKDFGQIMEAVGVEDAYGVIKSLLRQMEQMKISLYEQELEKKQIELNFRTIQIKPHFFINCLSGISCMADSGDMEGIRKISRQVSDYVRYVLRDGFEKVGLDQELDYVKNYVALQSHWCADRLELKISEEKGVQRTLLPGLIISTFVENSIRHGADGEGDIRITVTAAAEEAKDGKNVFLFLRIEDNAGGFPEELLQELNCSDKPVQEVEGHHLGINNALTRLKLIYLGKAKIRFTNIAAGEIPAQASAGACVELWIPQ